MNLRSVHRRFPIVAMVVLLIAGALSCNTPLSSAPVLSNPGTTTTIILVRHAERPEGLDPPLSAEGQQRANALADVLGEQGVTAIYAPDLLRNRQTVEPLAQRLGIEVNLVTALQMADTKSLANQLVDEILEQHAGGVVLWAGNIGPVTETQSGNLQELYTRLGGTGRAPTRYQDLYIAIIPDEGEVHFIKAQYGGPSSLD
jgi:hypothetical protein